MGFRVAKWVTQDQGAGRRRAKAHTLGFVIKKYDASILLEQLMYRPCYHPFVWPNEIKIGNKFKCISR